MIIIPVLKAFSVFIIDDALDSNSANIKCIYHDIC